MLYQKSISRTPDFRVIVLLFFLLTLIVVAGCEGGKDRPAAIAMNAKESPKVLVATALQSVRRELAIVGYNYTAKSINSFDVGPVGGGNIHLSSETGGGGGIVCCFSFQREVGPRPINVEWTDSICKYNVATHGNGATTFTVHRELRKSLVEIATPVPSDFQYLEIHFYPNGTVQAAITEAISPPRIVPSKSRGNPLPICPNNSKPG